MDVFCPAHAKFGGDRFTHGDEKTKKEVLCLFMFVCDAGRGLFWSSKPCQNGGTCSEDFPRNDYNCVCKPPFS